jgi:Ca2+-binding EF-hand superfamily protein
MISKVNISLRDATEIARLREDFEYYDRNKDGLMEYDEFVRFLGAADARMTEGECRIGFGEIDTDRDGVVEFDEFLEWWGAP